jgi:hypothetical protein
MFRREKWNAIQMMATRSACFARLNGWQAAFKNKCLAIHINFESRLLALKPAYLSVLVYVTVSLGILPSR